MKVYAVKKGNSTGIFESWTECQAATKGFAGAEFKSFNTREEAEAYLEDRDAWVEKVARDNENGYLVDKNNQEEFVKRIMDVYMGKLKDYKKYNKERIQMFLLENVIKEISSIYEKNM